MSNSNYTFDNYLIPTADYGTNMPPSDLGTQNNPYLVSDTSDLEKLALSVLHELDLNNVYFKQNEDITYNNDANIVPIGYKASGITPYTSSYNIVDIKSPFSGHYDGNNHSLKFNGTVTFSKLPGMGEFTSIPEYMGVFGWVKDGSVRNLNIQYNNIVSAPNLISCDYPDNPTANSNFANYFGGFAGCLENGIIERCAVTSSTFFLEIIEIWENLGGFVGINKGIVNDCFTNIYRLKGSNQYSSSPNFYCSMGPKLGRNQGFAGLAVENSGTITNCYSRIQNFDYNFTDGTNNNVGMFISNNTGTVSNSYWLSDAIYNGIYSGSQPPTGGSRTLAELQAQSTFIGWDFNNIWNICAAINDGMPYLRTSNEEQQSQTITFPTIPTKTYGDAPITLFATSTSDLPITYQSSNMAVATISGSTLTIVGAGTATITATQTGNCDYNAATPISQIFTVDKAQLTATADNKTREYGEANPLFTITYSGWKNGENVNSLTTQPTATCTATPTSNVGTYPITVSGGVATNYDFQYYDGTLIVTKATQEIPAPTMESNTITSITLNIVFGCEYNINDSDWQDSPIFEGLAPNTSYSFKQRMSETETHLASESPAVDFSTQSLNISENLLNNLNLYPNPTTGMLTIENGEWRIENVEIFDIYGRKLYFSTRPLVHSSTVNIDISHLSAGVYFLKINTETGMVVKKVLKE